MSPRLKRMVEVLVVLALAMIVIAGLPAVAEAKDVASKKDAFSAPSAVPNRMSIVVRPGDSLWSISQERLGPNAAPRRVLVQVQRTYARNRSTIGANPNLILPGQQLLLPRVGKPAGREPAVAGRVSESSAERPAKPVAPKKALRPSVETATKQASPDSSRKPESVGTVPERLPNPVHEPTPALSGTAPGPAAEQPSDPSKDPEGVLDWGKRYVGYPLWSLLDQPRTYLATVLVVLIAVYVYALAVVAAFAGRKRDQRGSDDLFFVLLVPALNEESVIGKTVASLLALHGNFLVLVIDDASDDGTAAAIVPFLADRRVQLLEQPPERARQGKGHVLNAGYAAVQRLKIAERCDPENVIVAVFDSDARVEPNFLQEVAPYFRDPRVAGVQAAVRMYNANQNLLTLWQHLEFAVWGKVLCRAKNVFGSATLGGNGQCTRLAALAELGTAPWDASSLTEDLDLSLRLLIKGWRLRFCSAVSVSQEAVPKLGRLVRQRSRWMQGHLVCWRHLPDLLRCPLPVYTRLDLLLFLLLPAAILPVGLASINSWSYFLLSFGRWDSWDLLAWYALGFVAAPLAVASLRLDGYPPLRSVAQGHLFVFYSFVWFLAGLAACWNVMLGRRAWAKTSRVGAETGGPEPPRPSTSPLVPEEETDYARRLIYGR